MQSVAHIMATPPTIDSVAALYVTVMESAIIALTADSKLVGNQVDRYHRSCVSFYSG